MSEVRRRVVAIEKDSKNQHGGYDYVSAEAMISKTRSAMLDVGLVFARKSGVIEDVGGCLILRGEFVVIDTDYGEAFTFSLDLPCPPRKGMPEDKAAMAALTSSVNYALRDLLMVSRGREDQIEASDESRNPREVQVDVIAESLNMEVAADTRTSGTNLDRLKKLAASPVTPDNAEQMWIDAANQWIKKNIDDYGGKGRTVTSLDGIPDQFAEIVIEKYREDYLAYMRKEAA